MEEIVLCEAQGYSGKLVLFSDRVLINREKRRAFLPFAAQGNKTILLKDISAVQFRSAGTLIRPGFLQIEYFGRQENMQDHMARALLDENTVTFIKRQEPAFIKLKETLEERLLALQATSQVSPSPMQELEKLAELKDKGVVTEEEFQAKKKQLLALPPAL